ICFALAGRVHAQSAIATEDQITDVQTVLGGKIVTYVFDPSKPSASNTNEIAPDGIFPGNDLCCPGGTTLISGGGVCNSDGHRLRETRPLEGTECWRVSCADPFPSPEGIGGIVIRCTF